MIDYARLLAAYDRVRGELLSHRAAAGHWVGELASSSLSTATAVGALALVERHDPTDARCGRYVDEARESILSELIVRGLHWLADHQNDDGGWGDTGRSHSNIATTMLVVSAFHLTGVPAEHSDLLQRAHRYIESAGGIAALRRRYGKDKTFAAPILAACAFADVVRWEDVTPLPFELACVPQRLYRWARLPVVSYAIPALVAIGQARFMRRKPWNPITRMIRSASIGRSLDVLIRMQPGSGGYLEAVPLTSFVVMGLAGTGRVQHPVTQRGVDFLLSTVRPDGSWPIDTDLATWNTTLAINALAATGERDALLDAECLDWLLNCQRTETHPFTGAEPGGWGWSDRSGAVPDADDTAGALLALNRWRQRRGQNAQESVRIRAAALSGLRWLLDLQNADGGWPTFCRGWGKLPFDRSGVDLTAHVLRALFAWRDVLDRQILVAALSRGFQYIAGRQNPDGSWTPLWFGNQDHPREENPVYGTSRVLMAYRDLGRLDRGPAQRALAWLVSTQNSDGGWGGEVRRDVTPTGPDLVSSVEETSLAVEALLAAHGKSTAAIGAACRGIEWLMHAMEEGRHTQASPIGFYFAKLWYYERLYPLIFSTAALGEAVRTLIPRQQAVVG